jgi:protein-tyrosine-phosphatase
MGIDKQRTEGQNMEERKIVFVCTGNTCRSPMAEAVLRSELRRLRIENVSVFSAGLNATETNFLNPKAAVVLAEQGLSLINFNARALDEDILLGAYALVCMTDGQKRALSEKKSAVLKGSDKRLKGENKNNIYSFSEIAGYDIPDPYGQDTDCYRRTFDKIAGGMSALIEKFFPEVLKKNDEEAMQKQ